ncbi:MAG: sulfurtransferase TusA family protein [Gammaproteobacteria bacterium]|nr:sulfurtransferase TusA family protein [Gammaproteobacteria bacterium]
MNIDKEINARGLNCPLPLMKTKKTLKEMGSGQVLRVIATDSGSMPDILELVTETGHTMLDQQHVGNEYIHTIRCK